MAQVTAKLLVAVPGATGLGPHSLSVIVRAGHVISADQANQLAASRLEPLRANRTIPGNVFVRSTREVTRACSERAGFLLDGRSRCREKITCLPLDPSILRVNGRSPWFHGAFHGPTVIAHPLVREKRLVGGREWRVGALGIWECCRHDAAFWDRLVWSARAAIAGTRLSTPLHCVEGRWRHDVDDRRRVRGGRVLETDGYMGAS